MKKLGALGTVTALIGALMFVGVSSASAHTPAVSATCNGVTVSGSNYEAGDTNTLSVSVNGGGSDTKTFATSGSATASVPQDGVAHTYTAYAHTTNNNPAYSHDYSGTVGPCGTPTKPADAVEHRSVVDTPNCTTHVVTTEHQTRTIPTVLVNNVWTPGTPTAWVTDSTTNRVTTTDECAMGPQPQADKQVRDVMDTPNCTDFTETTEHESRTRTYSFDAATFTYIAGAWTDWATDSSTDTAATLQECPPTIKPDQTLSSTQHTTQKCGDDFATTTTTTTTTDFVLDEMTRTWVLGVPVVEDTSVNSPVTAVNCVTNVNHVKPVAGTPTASGALPNTGGVSLGYGVAGLMLLLSGFFVLSFQRRKVAND